jgi:hypothetical protein
VTRRTVAIEAGLSLQAGHPPLPFIRAIEYLYMERAHAYEVVAALLIGARAYSDSSVSPMGLWIEQANDTLWEIWF